MRPVERCELINVFFAVNTEGLGFRRNFHFEGKEKELITEGYVYRHTDMTSGNGQREGHYHVFLRSYGNCYFIDLSREGVIICAVASDRIEEFELKVTADHVDRLLSHAINESLRVLSLREGEKLDSEAYDYAAG